MSSGSGIKPGQVHSGKGLGSVPIIDFRPYNDAAGDLHDARRSRMMRQRLFAADGHADNQVIVTVHPEMETEPLLAELFLEMDRWLTAAGADTAPAPNAAERVARNRPPALSDACYSSAGAKITDPEICAELYPLSLQPRLAAGAPLTGDVLKCALRPVDADDYAQALSKAQIERLEAIFSDGVCDYRQPAVGMHPVAGTWLSYPSPGLFSPLLN